MLRWGKAHAASAAHGLSCVLPLVFARNAAAAVATTTHLSGLLRKKDLRVLDFMLGAAGSRARAARGVRSYEDCRNALQKTKRKIGILFFATWTFKFPPALFPCFSTFFPTAGQRTHFLRFSAYSTPILVRPALCAVPPDTPRSTTAQQPAPPHRTGIHHEVRPGHLHA